MMFIKSILASIKRKWGAPLVIVITVTIAVAVFISALALRASIKTTMTDLYRALGGSSDLQATLSEENETYWLTDGVLLNKLQSEADKYGELRKGYDLYASANIDDSVAFVKVYATNLADFAEYNDFEITVGALDNSRTGVVISENFAKKHSLQIDSEFSLSLYGSAGKVNCYVTAIGAKGAFLTQDILCSEQIASRLVGLGDSVGVYNSFFISFDGDKLRANNLSSAQAQSALAGALPNFKITSPINDEDLSSMLSYQSVILLVIAFIVAMLGVVLIYTSFVVVTKDRLHTASLFKSVGAERKVLFGYLAAESIIYGLVGSLIGVGLSFGIGALFSVIAGITVTSFTVSFGEIAVGILFGVILSFLASTLPSLKLASLSLYDMLHVASPISDEGKLPLFISAGAFALFFILVWFMPVSSALYVGVISAIAIIALVVTALPFVVKYASLLIMKCSAKASYGVVYLSASGAKNSKSVNSGGRLLIVATTAIILIAVLLGEAQAQMNSFDNLFTCDVQLQTSTTESDNLLSEVRLENGVQEAYSAYIETRCAVKDAETTVVVLGARGQEYDKVFNTKSFGIASVKSLQGGRKAIIGEGLAMKLGIDVGDTFEVRVGGEYISFVLADTCDTPLTVLFTDANFLDKGYNTIFVKSNSSEIYDNLAQKYSRKAVCYRTEDAFDYVTEIAHSYIRVFTLFEIVVAVFAVVGYIINAINSYRDRKHEFELLALAGANKSQRAGIVALESAVIVICSMVIAGLASFLLICVIQNMLKTLGLFFHIIG